nr:NEFA interacting nuclear protein NIP30 N terminal [Hymenolepis microstoma]
MSSNAPRFISEKDIEERKARDAAEGKIEEPYDPRSLYDRLQAERARKQEEYESQRAFKNQIHRLDDEEVAFLVEKDLEKCRNEESAEEEARKLIEEAKISFNSSHLFNLLFSFLQICSLTFTLRVKPQINRTPLPSSSSTLNQKALLAGIKRRQPNSPSEIGSKRPHLEQSDDTFDSNTSSSTNPQTSESSSEGKTQENTASTGPACVLAGILPGLYAYENSSDDDDSEEDSSSDVEDAARTISSIVDSLVKKSRKETNE